MRNRIWAVLLSACLLVGLLPTTALAGGDVAQFFIFHDYENAKDQICTGAGEELLLPGTHGVSVRETDYVEIDIGNDGTYEIRVPFLDFIAGDPDWSISWSVNINGEVKDVESGQATSIAVDCPPLNEGEASYSIYVYATLTATYQGTAYTVTGATGLRIQDPIWKLPEGEETVHVVDRNGAEDFAVPLTPPDTLMRYTSEKPRGEEVPLPSGFTVSYEVYDGSQEIASGDATLDDPHPGCYRVYTTVKDQDGDSVAYYNQYYFVTDGDVVARQALTDTVTWTLTEDGTLTFSGEGEVPGRGTSQRGWEEFVTQYGEHKPGYKITKVVAEEGITALGSYVLRTYNSDRLESVTLPSTLTKLGNNVFDGYEIASATYNGDSWASVALGDGNENLNSLLAEDGIALWVENNRLYGRFTDPQSGNYDRYRLYFYDSTQASGPEDYIYVSMESPDTAIDLTDMYGYGTLDRFAIYEIGTEPESSEPLYDVALAKPIRFQTDAFDFPAADVTVSVEENRDEETSQYDPYIVTFSNLAAGYLYELENRDTHYSWKFEGNSIGADKNVFGACALSAIYAQEDAGGFRIVSSEAYSLTIAENAQPALPEQKVMVPASLVTKTYGDADFYNTAANTSPGGGALTYASGNTDVVEVDADTGKVTIVGAGEAVITVTAAAVPGRYAETSANYTVRVEKAPLTITAKGKTIRFGEKASYDGYTAAGFVKGEDESVLSGEGVYHCDYQQYGAVGEYEISVSGLTARNYDITFEAGALIVEKAAEYTITLGKLEQLAGHTSAVTAQITPYDDTAEFSVEYQVNNGWTTEVPKDAGEYPVRAALTASGNIESQPAAYTYGTLVVKQGVTVDTGSGTADVDVAVTVDSGKAEITVEDDQLEKILADADGEVSLDLSGVKDTDELVLPGNLISGLSGAEKAERLTVSTEDASVTLSAPVLDAVADAVTGGTDTVSIRLASVAEDELNDAQREALKDITSDYPVSVVDVSLVVTHPDGSEDVFHELGGDVTVTVPYEPGLLEGRYVVACYVSDDGTVTYLFAEASEDGRTITFTTNHFSHYAVFVSSKPSVQVNGGSGSGLYAPGSQVTITAGSRSGYAFDRWEVVSGEITLADKSSAQTTFTMPAGAVELTAVYTKNSTGGNTSSTTGGSVPSGRGYIVRVESSKNGKVTVSPGRACRGDTVTITVSPDAGCELRALAVTDKNGERVKVTYKSANKYTFTMPSGKVTVTAAFAEIRGELPFADVEEGAWYAQAVRYVYGKGLMTGVTADAFAPSAATSRAMLTAILYRLEGEPGGAAAAFLDVESGMYYTDAVAWASSEGIVTGYEDGTFAPDKSITREEMAVMLYRYAQYKGCGTETGGMAIREYDDYAEISQYALPALRWAVSEGLVTGTTDTTLTPDGTATRAQVAAILMRFVEDSAAA